MSEEMKNNGRNINYQVESIGDTTESKEEQIYEFALELFLIYILGETKKANLNNKVYEKLNKTYLSVGKKKTSFFKSFCVDFGFKTIKDAREFGTHFNICYKTSKFPASYSNTSWEPIKNKLFNVLNDLYKENKCFENMELV
jgi:hypothetical protein